MEGTSQARGSIRRVEAHGLGIHIQEWPGGSPPVVMLHALGFTGRLFDPLAQALSPRYKVLCPDLRGHGRTDHPPEGYQFPNLVRDLAALLQMLRLSRVVLIGHTWGADIAMSFAAAHPGRLLGLVLLDGGYRHRREVPADASKNPPDPNLASQRFPSVAAAVADAQAQLGIAWSDHLQLALEDSLEVGRDGSVGYRLDDHRWQQIYRQLWQYDPSPLMMAVQTPTLVVHPVGKNASSPADAVSAFQARAAGLLMANAEVLSVPAEDNLNMVASPLLAQRVQALLEQVGGEEKASSPRAMP